MNGSMAESYYRYGYRDHHTEVKLDEGSQLVFFVDGSTVMESPRGITIFGSVWDQTKDAIPAKKPDFEFERFMKKVLYF